MSCEAWRPSMKGGPNAFLRSMPPLELSALDAAPSQQWSASLCSRLYRVSAAGSLLLVCVYCSSFFGLALQGYGWTAIPMAVGGFALLSPLSRYEFRQRRFWGGRWPFQKGVPAWARWAAVAAILPFVVTLLCSPTGEPRINDGVEVLWSKSDISTAITHLHYTQLPQAQLRLVTSWLAMGWLQAVIFWQFQTRQHAATR